MSPTMRMPLPMTDIEDSLLAASRRAPDRSLEGLVKMDMRSARE
jgi:hypothetical protein